jgi:hypothetical protein
MEQIERNIKKKINLSSKFLKEQLLGVAVDNKISRGE